MANRDDVNNFNYRPLRNIEINESQKLNKNNLGYIIVGIGEAAVTSCDETLMTIGLGSCVGVGMYDEKANVLSLIHIMLPNSDSIKDVNNRYKYADLAIPLVIDRMALLGANRKNIKAKIAGGASMFKLTNDAINNIGNKNVIAVREALRKEGVNIIAEDVGGNSGRTMIVHSNNFKVKIKVSGGIEKIL